MLTGARLLILCSALPAYAQIADYPADTVAGIPVNYTEALAGTYQLPDVLKLVDGKPVRDAKTWTAKRRPEIVALFEENQFGHSPARPKDMTFDVFEKNGSAFGGKAIRRQVTIFFTADKNGPRMDLLVYIPADAKKPVPLLLNAGFSANSSTVDDPDVKQGEVWGPDKKKALAPRGRGIGRMNAQRYIDAGLGVATFYYGDVEPDFLGGVGIRAQYPSYDWGAIAAWAWGMSRAMDYLETDSAIDAKRVAITGVSRLGKTVMWAGAHDERFALVIASCSGEGGAALSRRNYGETIAHLVAAGRYPYQFTPNYAKWGPHPDQSPVDAHMLVALIAPRPLLLQTGNTDKWSDPKGEFLSALAAAPVYQLFGKHGLDVTEVPPAGKPVLRDIGYEMHDGGHGMVPSDVDVYIDFLKMHMQK